MTSEEKFKKFFETKEKIQRLAEEQDNLFMDLLAALPINAEEADWLFELAFNSYSESFEKEKLQQILK